MVLQYGLKCRGGGRLGGMCMETHSIYGNCQVGYWSDWRLLWGQRSRMATVQPYLADLYWDGSC